MFEAWGDKTAVMKLWLKCRGVLSAGVADEPGSKATSNDDSMPYDAEIDVKTEWSETSDTRGLAVLLVMQRFHQ